MSEDRLGHIIEIWKTVVEVQRHFNDISMRIRGLFITLLLAMFASMGFLLDKGLDLQISIVHIQYAVVVPIFGAFGACLFYFIDRYWYHRLLIGSVKHGMAIEALHKDVLPELGLSDAIKAESGYKPTGLVKLLATWLVKHKDYREKGELRSDGKIEFFYKSVVAALILTFALLALFGGVSIRHGSNSDQTEDVSVVATPTQEKQKPQSLSESPPSLPTPQSDGDLPSGNSESSSNLGESGGQLQQEAPPPSEPPQEVQGSSAPPQEGNSSLPAQLDEGDNITSEPTSNDSTNGKGELGSDDPAIGSTDQDGTYEK